MPIEKRLDLIDKESEVVPGVLVSLVPGHTPGHITVTLRSNGEELIYLSDTVVHPLHLRRPDWHLSVDTDPKESVASRLRLLEKASGTNVLVQVNHFPFPGLGRIMKKGDTWDWRPIEM